MTPSTDDLGLPSLLSQTPVRNANGTHGLAGRVCCPCLTRAPILRHKEDNKVFTWLVLAFPNSHTFSLLRGMGIDNFQTQTH